MRIALLNPLLNLLLNPLRYRVPIMDQVNGCFVNTFQVLSGFWKSLPMTPVVAGLQRGQSSIFGDEFNDKFIALYGDSDGDGEVGTADVLRARRAFGLVWETPYTTRPLILMATSKSEPRICFEYVKRLDELAYRFSCLNL